MTLTFDLEHLQHIVCDVMKLCTKFECNRTIHGGVVAILVFDLMISKSVQNLSKIEQYPAELLIILRIYAHVMSRRDLDLGPVHFELLQHFGSGVVRLNSVQNLSEIE